MEKSELLKHCRYYKGENENPYEGKDQNKAMLWFYEWVWINDTLQGHSFNEMLEDYKEYGLEPFNADDGVPMSLKAQLFNRYMHWCGGYGKDEDVKGFKRFYSESYK